MVTDMFFKKKQVCFHCNDAKTKKDFEGVPACTECRMKILLGREQIYKCPADGTEMKKEIWNKTVIINRCPRCKGVWVGGESDVFSDNFEDF